jgi:hypothetical protein
MSEDPNVEYRRDAAAAVLRAMDVDDYLIEAVENARPPMPLPPVPPEPRGDVLVSTGDEVFHAAHPLDQWVSLQTDLNVPWSWLSQHEYKVYRPEPSPERIEELVRQYERRVHETGGVMRRVAVMRQFASDLLEGS